MKIDRHIGDKLKKLRRALKVPQGFLAKYIGISEHGVSLLERGERPWKPSYMYRLSELLNVDVSYFYKDFNQND